jgi:2-dehydro-3-deoxygluconokinase
MRVICIGECMVELRSAGGDRFLRSYAGDVYNTCVYLKRSLPQAEIQFLTATGDDAMSHAMRRAWGAERIDVSLAFVVKGGTPGLYLIETDAAGERSFHYWRKDSAARRWLQLLLEHGEETLLGADLIYISGIALAILSAQDRAAVLALLQRLRGRVGRIAFDPNVRASLWESQNTAVATLSAALAACDIALPSTDDLHWLFQLSSPEAQVDRLRELGVRETALTLGAQGCLVDHGGSRSALKSPAVARVIDTSGAGDAFNGAYLAGRLQGQTPAHAAAAALRIASRVVAHTGAIIAASHSHPAGADA